MPPVSLELALPAALHTPARPAPARPDRLPAETTFFSIFNSVSSSSTAVSTSAAPSLGTGPLRRAPEVKGLSQRLAGLWAEIGRDERRLDRYVRRALAGAELELPEIVAMQRLAFRYTQRVELLSKLVDRLTGAIRQTLQTQL